MTDAEEIIVVARTNRQDSDAVLNTLNEGIEKADVIIAESREILARYRKPEQPNSNKTALDTPPIVIRSFEEILVEANKSDPSPATIEDLLSPDEIKRVVNRLDSMRENFRFIHRMDGIDYAIAGCAGLLGALVDIFLIQMPKAPGLLGSQGTKGGPLANWIRERVNASIPPDRQTWLEGRFQVPYDAPVSTNLLQKIEGLSPRTHRLHSLGHDPLLSWIFGTADIMGSKMTAIDKYGNVISQAVAGTSDPTEMGMTLFASLYRVLGHLLSDVSTKAGLPVPLASLALFAQQKHGILGERSPAEIARAMYAKNYDFRHFLAMSTTPLLIECIVRIGYFWKEVASGKDWTDALPVQSPGGPRTPRLHSMLFTAHAIAAAANAGKIAVQGGFTPVGLLSLNYPQWIVLGRYSVSQAIWLSYSKPKEEIELVQSVLNEEWGTVFQNIDRLFTESSKAPFLINAG